ncbi:CS1-pili formation C-terminal domain-containing protein [Aeromonas enteropelogenes]|uniref:CS1-pili formation C-terminal domain-containing protein n=1 Tax=Aeromonas enteropelogenes TaxID=29489 RepID=UPI00398959B1
MSNKRHHVINHFYILWFIFLPHLVLAENSFSSNVPDEFKDSIYDVPLAVRMEVNDHYFSDALITLSKNNIIKLINLENSFEKSKFNDADKKIERRIMDGIALGSCNTDCVGIVKIEYDPNTSLLAIYTDKANSVSPKSTSFSIPENGATGLVLLSNFSGTKTDKNEAAYSYIGSAATNIGAWTGYSNFNISQNAGADTVYVLKDIYGQIDLEHEQLKIGFFTPDYTLSGGTYAALSNKSVSGLFGVSYGTHERFGQYGGSASLIPLTVTANQNGYIEVYKSNQLVGTFPVKAGIQSIPTEGFPDGIYSVDVKLYENGRLVSTSSSEINKAIGFYGSPFKYKFFAGKESYIGSPSFKKQNESLVQGGSLSYLVNSKLNIGATLLHDDDEVNSALSFSFDASNELRFYNNIYHSSQGEYGGEAQVMYGVNGFYSSFSTSYDSYGDDVDSDYTSSVSNKESFRSNLTLSGNLDRDQIYATISYDHLSNDKNISFGINYNLDDYLPLGSYLTASVNNSIVNGASAWGGTVNISVPIKMGSNGTSYASIGFASQRDSFGKIDNALIADYSNAYVDGVVRNVSVNGSVSDEYINGTLSGTLHTDHTLANGYYSVSQSKSEQISSSSNSVGINLNNALVLGPGAAVLSGGNGLGLSNTGVLIDVESSYDDGGLVAQVEGVGEVKLKPGSNFIPIQPYKNSVISYELSGGGDHGGATFSPLSDKVNLYPGGVAVKKVNVMRTVTVLGRIVDVDNNVLNGIEIRNHAGFAIPESDGIFVLELSVENPQMTVFRKDTVLCNIDYSQQVKSGNSMLINAGNLKCESTT